MMRRSPFTGSYLVTANVQEGGAILFCCYRSILLPFWGGRSRRKWKRKRGKVEWGRCARADVQFEAEEAFYVDCVQEV